jgi:hypothetical protein
MAPRSSLFSGYAQMHREAARAPAGRVQAEADARREAEYARRADLYGRATTKAQKRPYSGKSVTELNADLEATVKALEGILAVALKAGALVNFSSLKKPVSPPVWRPPELEPAQLPGFLELDRPADSTDLSWMGEELEQAVAASLARKRQAEAEERAKYEQAEAARQAKYEQVLSEHREREEQRSRALASVRAEWQAAVDAGEIDTF